MDYLKIPNFERYQHYKDRRPPWMKLHAELLQDYEFSILNDGEKYQIIAIWLLATQIGNKIPNDEDWICKQIQAKSCNINKFIELGMLLADCKQVDSKALHNFQNHSIVEAEAEAEADREYAKSPDKKIPYKKITDLYHEILNDLPKCIKLNQQRKGYIRQRWITDDMNELDNWKNFFEHVKTSDFLMGKKPGMNDSPPFIADFEWIIRPTNFIKIAEGKYHRSAL